MYQEALKIVTEVLGERHPHTQMAERNYLGCLSKSGAGGED